MTYYEISCLTPINDVDEDKVNTLVASMLENGWQGCPILVWGDQPLTGSHRIAALRKIQEMVDADEIEMPEVLSQDVAEDVSEIAEENYNKFAEENGWEKDIDFADIGWLLAGSWVEAYKDEIAEW